MPTIQIVDNFSSSPVNTPQTAFTATKDTMILSFTASNVTGIDASYKAYIQSSDGNLRAQIPFKIVAKNNIDLGIGIVNQVIPSGGAILVESSALDSIFFTVSGSEASI